MERHEEALIHIYGRKLELLQNSLRCLEQKTLCLVHNDLHGMEENLEEEARLLKQLAEIETRIQKDTIELAEIWKLESFQLDSRTLYQKLGLEAKEQWRALKKALQRVVEEIRVVNLRNRALVENGFQFCQAMLSAICPAPTYYPRMSIPHLPVQPILSVEG